MPIISLVGGSGPPPLSHESVTTVPPNVAL